MGKNITFILIFTLLAGCAGLGRNGSGQEETIDIPSRGDDSSQVFSLPGVPMKYMPPQGWAKPKPKTETAAETPAPAAAPAAPPEEKPAAPAAPQPEAAAAKPEGDKAGDLEFHLSAARKYAARKHYRSAAAEYAAAAPFLPAGDARAVHLLERQGAMLLRSGDEAKAAGLFSAAIGKAKELKAAGGDLANAHLGLGYCLEKKNDVPAALANYEKALQLSSSRTIKARIAKTIDDLKAKK